MSLRKRLGPIQFIEDVSGITEAKRMLNQHSAELRICDQRLDQLAIRWFIFKTAIYNNGNGDAIHTITDAVNHFDDIVKYENETINGVRNGEMLKYDDWKKRAFVEKAFWIAKHFRAWTHDGNFLTFLEGEASSPDGVVWLSCPKCGTIYIARDDEEDILHPHVCEICAHKAGYTDYTSPWQIVRPEDEEYEQTKKYVVWERRYWSDKGLQVWVALKVKASIIFEKIFHPLRWRKLRQKWAQAL